MGLAAVSFVDPISALQDIGLMSAEWHWTIGPEARRAIFLALAFLWMAAWFHKRRIEFEDKWPLNPAMPLHEVCRYIARESVWAAQYPSTTDSNWVSQVDAELMSKLLMGRVEAFGQYRFDNHQRYGPTKAIPVTFLETAEWNSHHLVMQSPPTHMWRLGGGVYKNVLFDRGQIERIWPRRTLWHKLQGCSPIDRISRTKRPDSYDDLFRQQDLNYARIRNGEFPDSPFDVAFEEASHA